MLSALDTKSVSLTQVRTRLNIPRVIRLTTQIGSDDDALGRLGAVAWLSRVGMACA